MVFPKMKAEWDYDAYTQEMTHLGYSTHVYVSRQGRLTFTAQMGLWDEKTANWVEIHHTTTPEARVKLGLDKT